MPKRKKKCKNAKRMVRLYKEISIAKEFEVPNGILGLERDVYLSVVKFLSSSVVRRV
jgi:hypothetical protein